MFIIILLVLIFGVIVSAVFLKNVKSSWRFIYIAIFSATLLMLVALFISDPGIIEKNQSEPDLEDNDRVICTYCNTTKKQRGQHCHDCGVCIFNYDHHCDVIGKCIGGKNLFLFYIFVFLLPVFFIVSILYISNAV